MTSAADDDLYDRQHAFQDELRPGTLLLQGQYQIDTYLNSGGFGITYLARDSLERTVVIKECFPESFCRRDGTGVLPRSRAHADEFRAIVRLFVKEARNLSAQRHRGIVGVHQVFEDNNTAYMALDFVEGRDLLDIINEAKHMLSPGRVKEILLKTLDAISAVHEADFLHRDISPDNILIDRDWEPVLIDFGAAREQATRASRALSTMLVVKDGYSPQEFYTAGSSQSAASDLYSLGATFYHVIAGTPPPNSQVRLAAIASGDPDPLKPLASLDISGYEPGLLASIDLALAVLPKDRFQSAKEWTTEVHSSLTRETARVRAAQDTQIETSVVSLVQETNPDILSKDNKEEPVEQAPAPELRSRRRQRIIRPQIQARVHRPYEREGKRYDPYKEIKKRERKQATSRRRAPRLLRAAQVAAIFIMLGFGAEHMKSMAAETSVGSLVRQVSIVE